MAFIFFYFVQNFIVFKEIFICVCYSWLQQSSLCDIIFIYCGITIDTYMSKSSQTRHKLRWTFYRHKIHLVPVFKTRKQLLLGSVYVCVCVYNSIKSHLNSTCCIENILLVVIINGTNHFCCDWVNINIIAYCTKFSPVQFPFNARRENAVKVNKSKLTLFPSPRLHLILY